MLKNLFYQWKYKTETIILFLLIVIPFITYEKVMFGGYTAKYFWFYLVISLIILEYIIILLSSVKIDINLSKADIMILCFWGLYFCRNLFTEIDFLNNKFLTITYLIVIYFYVKKFVIHIKENVKYIDFLFIILIIISIIQCIIGLLQLYGYLESNSLFFKITGTFFNPAPLAMYLVCCLPVSIVMYFNSSKKENKPEKFINFISALSIILILITIPATLNRASWIAAIISSTLIFSIQFNIVSKIKSLSNKNKILLFGSIVILVVVLSFVLFKLKPDSTIGRFFVLNNSIEMVKANPFGGHGIGSFEAKYSLYQANYFQKHGFDNQFAYLADYVILAYNDFLEILIELGVVGIGLFLAFIYFMMKSYIKHYQTLYNSYIFFISFNVGISFIVLSLFSYPQSSLPLVILFFIFCGILSSKHESILKFSISNSIKNLLSFLLIIYLLGISYWGIRNFSNFINWRNAYVFYELGNYQKASEEFKEINGFDKNGYFLSMYGKSLEMANNYQEAISILESAKKYSSTPIIYISLGNCYKSLNHFSEAEQAYRTALGIQPNSIYIKYNMVMLYKEMNRIQDAILLANNILNSKDKVPSDATKEIRKGLQDFLKSHSMKIIQ